MKKKDPIDQKIRELQDQIEFLKKQLPKKEMGRPSLFNKEQVKMLELVCSFPGITEQGVCHVMNCTRSALEKFIRRRYDLTFSAFRDQKKDKMKSMLLSKQFEVAMHGNVTMLIWLGKQHLDQSEKQKTMLSNETNSAPFQLIINEPKD